jgi:hypothetical protein
MIFVLRQLPQHPHMAQSIKICFKKFPKKNLAIRISEPYNHGMHRQQAVVAVDWNGLSYAILT